jgi:hypothetical protein
MVVALRFGDRPRLIFTEPFVFTIVNVFVVRFHSGTFQNTYFRVIYPSISINCRTIAIPMAIGALILFLLSFEG